MSEITKKVEARLEDHDFCGEILDDAFENVQGRLPEYLTEEELTEIGDDEEKMRQAIQAVNRAFVTWLYKTYVG